MLRRALLPCLLAVSLSCAGPDTDAPEDRGREASPGLNVVLIVMDTARLELLSVYGFEEDTSPNLKALSDEGVLFSQAYSTSSWTVPAHGSLFTGLYSIGHGATQEHWRLEDYNVTLAEVLRDHNYDTFAIVENGMLAASQGFAQGFHSYQEIWRIKNKPISLNHSLDAFRLFVKNRKAKNPYFVFVNLIAPHSPYTSSKPFTNRFVTDVSLTVTSNRWRDYYLGNVVFSEDQMQHLKELYQAELYYTDHVVGKMREALEEAGDWDNTLFIVTSDHGEHFGEHGHVDHVFSLHQPLVRVPLIVHEARHFIGGKTDSRPVQLLDLFPTVLSIVGIESGKYAVHGQDLVDGAIAPDRPLYLEYHNPKQTFNALGKRAAEDYLKLEPYHRALRAVIQDDMKFIWSSDGQHEFYDLKNDPNEMVELSSLDAFRARREELHALLNDFVNTYHGDGLPTDPITSEIADDETREALRALGYIE